MNTNTEADIKTLRAEMAQLRTDLASISQTIGDLARHGRGDAIGKARQTAEQVEADIKRRIEGVTHQIEERPLGAALAAFGVGLILGLLFGGRRS